IAFRALSPASPLAMPSTRWHLHRESPLPATRRLLLVQRRTQWLSPLALRTPPWPEPGLGRQSERQSSLRQCIRPRCDASLRLSPTTTSNTDPASPADSHFSARTVHVGAKP